MVVSTMIFYGPLNIYESGQPFNYIFFCIYMKGDGFDPSACKEYVNSTFESSVYQSLFDYIKIKNLSRAYDPEWATNGLLEEAAEHIKSWVQGFGIKGLTTEIIKDEGYTPLIYTEIAGDIPDMTVLFYGHFDKQPYNEADWDAPKHPYKPYREPTTDRLYGRGGADDGYSTYSSMLAVKAVQQQGHPIPSTHPHYA